MQGCLRSDAHNRSPMQTSPKMSPTVCASSILLSVSAFLLLSCLVSHYPWLPASVSSPPTYQTKTHADKLWCKGLHAQELLIAVISQKKICRLSWTIKMKLFFAWKTQFQRILASYSADATSLINVKSWQNLLKSDADLTSHTADSFKWKQR